MEQPLTGKVTLGYNNLVDNTATPDYAFTGTNFTFKMNRNQDGRQQTCDGWNNGLNFKKNATAINVPTFRPTPKDGAVYNLAGQRVSKSYKGIVIINGKKYIQK